MDINEITDYSDRLKTEKLIKKYPGVKVTYSPGSFGLASCWIIGQPKNPLDPIEF